MREMLLKNVSPERTREENLNFLRQSLQILLLKILHESNAGAALAFTGGTALRLLHDLPRFSEDLDFSLVAPKKYDFEQLVTYVERSLQRLALVADLKRKTDKTVHHLFVRFQELLFESELTKQKSEKLPIRLEIDTNPPAGWRTQISLLSDFYTFPVLHFDLPSAFATKLHACLFRRYAKGRDFYDLLWYLGKKIKPNLLVLNHAIAQTEATATNVDAESLRQALLKRIARLNFSRLRNDIAPFLMHPEEIKLFEAELMLQAVQSYDF